MTAIEPSNYTNTYFGSDEQKAIKFVKKLYINSSSFDVINSGYENLVVIVDDVYAVRFPRSQEIWERGQVERLVLRELSKQADLKIPRVIAANENPPYLITQYLHGRQLDVSIVRQLPQDTKKRIGQSVAEFAYALHATIPIEMISQSLIQQKSTYDDYLNRVLIDRTDPSPTVDNLAKSYYSAWQNMSKDKTVVVHDDLHTGNLLFDKDYQLTGVLDFGAVCIGSPEQDLRQTYRLGEDVLEAAASRYEELSCKSFNREAAKIWTITQELGAYCREDAGEAHDRAKANLEFWFGELA